MINNKDLNNLIVGATYNVKVVPKNLEGINEQDIPSFNYQFTVPNDWPVGSGSLIEVTNSSTKQKLSGSAGIYSATNMFMTGRGIFAYKAGLPLLDSNRTVFIDSSTGNAYFSGSVIATSGSIGGFSITNNQLYASVSGPKFTGLKPSTYPFFSGATTSDGTDGTFRVDTQGNLYAQSASFAGTLTAPTIITGSITANAASFGFSTNSQLVGGAIYVPSKTGAQFTVDSGGNVVAQSASITGNITANAGYIGGTGGWKISTGYIRSGAGSGSITLDGANNQIYIGSGSYNDPNTSFYVDGSGQLSLRNKLTFDTSGNLSISGTITAVSGAIAGWSISNQELYKNPVGQSNHIALNSDPTNPKIYIGQGNHASQDTGFYVDSTGRFSLSNQLYFTPGKGSAQSSSTVASTNITSYQITTTIDNSSGSVLYKGILAMGPDLDIDTYASSVTNTNPAIVILSKYPLNTNATSSITFKADDFSQLTVTGKIKGEVESITPIQSPKLFSTITSASVGVGGSVVVFGTNGHSFISGEHLILQGLPTSGSLSNLNYTASSGNSYSIISASNSSSFSISTPTSASLIAGNYSPISGSVSIQELTMGLHPSEGYAGLSVNDLSRDSWYHDSGIGIRLDKYNWWFTNNQFRVGTDQTSFKWDGSKFKIKGGGSYTLEMSVGAADSNNYFAIYSPIQETGYSNTYDNVYRSGIGVPLFNDLGTPFYVDATGQFSLGTYLTWTPSSSTLIVKGSGSFSGNITASSGNIGGWTIGTNNLNSGSAASEIALSSYIDPNSSSNSTMIWSGGADPLTVRNLLLNPSFESGNTNYWFIGDAVNASVTTASPYYGIYCLQMKVNSIGASAISQAYISRQPNLSAGNAYTLSFYVRTDSGTVNGLASFYPNPIGAPTVFGYNYFTANSSWQRISITLPSSLVTTSTTGIFYIGMNGSPSSSVNDVMYVDAVQLEVNSSATQYIESAKFTVDRYGNALVSNLTGSQLNLFDYSAPIGNLFINSNQKVSWTVFDPLYSGSYSKFNSNNSTIQLSSYEERRSRVDRKGSVSAITSYQEIRSYNSIGQLSSTSSGNVYLYQDSYKAWRMGPELIVTGTNDSAYINGLRLGAWNLGSNYAGLHSNSAYMIMTDGTNTYVGSESAGVTAIRSDNNDQSNQIVIWPPSQGTAYTTEGITIRGDIGINLIANAVDGFTDGITLTSNSIYTNGIKLNAGPGGVQIDKYFMVALGGTGEVGIGPGGTSGTPASNRIFKTDFDAPAGTANVSALYVQSGANIDSRYRYILRIISSSLKTKNLIGNYEINKNDFMKIQPRLFSWKEDSNNRPRGGFILEEIETIESLHPFINLDPAGEFQSIDYGGMVAMLTDIVQKQQNTIDSLTSRIETLETLISGSTVV